MKTMKYIIALPLTLFFTFSTQAKIYFDLEAEPLPIVDISVLIPQGSQTNQANQAGLAMSFSDILSSGTINKNKQEFNDELAKFGADYSFSVGNHYSYWNLSFPYIEGKDYQPLIQLLNENWKSPRFTKTQYNLAMVKIDAGFKSSLDSDAKLLNFTMHNFINKTYLGGFPEFLDTVKKNSSLERAHKYFKENFITTNHIWAGVIAPEKTKEVAQQILQGVFTKQGSIQETTLKKQLKPQVDTTESIKNEKTFFVIDRKGRAQTIMGMIAISPESLDQGNELDFYFADHLLFSNGIDAYFNYVIRTQKGLAYSTSSISTQYRDHKVLSLITNPQASKMEEAFVTVSTLINETLVKNSSLKVIDQSRWNRALESYKNAQAINNGMPDKRLANRSSVITGSQSYKLAMSDPDDWKVSRSDVSKLIENHWNKSAITVAAVGELSKIKPLVKKYFPDYKLIVVPYRDAIYSKAIP